MSNELESSNKVHVDDYARQTFFGKDAGTVRGLNSLPQTAVSSPVMPTIATHGFPSVVRHLSPSTRSMPFERQRVGPRTDGGIGAGLVFDGEGRPPARAVEVTADFGAASGGEGAFGWYSDHPVALV